MKKEVETNHNTFLIELYLICNDIQ